MCSTCCRGGVGVAGVYKSTNGGLDWTASPIYTAPVPVDRIVENGRIAVCQGAPSTLVYVYEFGE